VDSWKVEGDESELEQLFAESRRYALLSAEQEREIDGSKWRAVEALQHVFLDSEGARAWLTDFLDALGTQALEVAGFGNREHHFLLRREVGQYLPGARLAPARELLRATLATPGQRGGADQLAELAFSASLTAGIGNLIMRHQGTAVRCAVADALADWLPTVQMGHSRYQLSGEARQQLKLALSRYNQARDTLVLHNLRLVYAIAGKSVGKGIAYRDLIQEGTLGLIRAAEKFEARKGYRFSTYSYNWISQAIRRYQQDGAALIRFPSHVRDQIGRVYREREALRASSGNEPGEALLAEAAGMEAKQVRAIQQLRNITVSLDAPAWEDDDDTLLDQLTDQDDIEPDGQASTRSLHRHLLRELEQLDPTERQVVIARWGLHRGRPLSRAEVAEQLSVSREWVRQLERSALDKLARNPALQETARDWVITS